MFCPYCGATVVDGASFCATCGKQVVAAPVASNIAEAQAQQYQMQKAVARKAEIDSMTNALSYFAQKEDVFNEYDHVCQQVNYYGRGAKGALLVWGCILATIGLLFAAIFSENEPESMPVAYIFLFPGILMIIGGILMKVNNHRKFAHYKEKYGYLSTELYHHYIAYPECPVGPEYANPQVLRYLINLMQSGRADTVKESIQLAMSGRRQGSVMEYFSNLKRNVEEVTEETRIPTFFAPSRYFD